MPGITGLSQPHACVRVLSFFYYVFNALYNAVEVGEVTRIDVLFVRRYIASEVVAVCGFACMKTDFIKICIFIFSIALHCYLLLCISGFF